MPTKAELEAELATAKVAWEALIKGAAKKAEDEGYCNVYTEIIDELADEIVVPEGFLPINPKKNYRVLRRVRWVLEYDEVFSGEGRSEFDAISEATNIATELGARSTDELLTAVEAIEGDDDYRNDYLRPSILVEVLRWWAEKEDD